MTLRALLHSREKKSYVILRGVHMIIKLAIKVRVQQFEGGRRINFGFSFKRYTAHYAAKASWDVRICSLSTALNTAGVLGDL